MKLYVVRHGQTDENANNTNSSNTDPALNKLGREQAAHLADDLKGLKIDLIITSPLLRARQTADIVNSNHKLKVRTDKVWQERNIGQYIDLATWNDAFNFDKKSTLENGESIQNFFSRVYAALDTLSEDHKNQTVLLVTHGGVHHAIYAYANHLPWKGNMLISSRLQNCEYRMYEL